jgi:O-methyltransferase domain
VTNRLPPAWVVRPLFAVRNGLSRLSDAIVPPQLPLVERLFGIADTKSIAVAADLGIADLLADARRDASALAAACGVNADALARMLRYLVSRGVFQMDRRGRYRNNRVSSLLRTEQTTSQHAWARFVGSRWHVDIWNHLDEAVHTGNSAAVAAFGHSFWEQLTQTDPEAGSLFDSAMEDASRLQVALIPRIHDFSRCQQVCDVGGGTGTVLASVLAANPTARGVLFDLPSVIARATPVVDRAGVADRVSLRAGDFFEAVPQGCDRYLLQAIMHDWDDDSCVRILTNVRKAMARDARVLVFEQELPRHGGKDLAKLIDLEMLVDTGGGRERTGQEFIALFARAGLRVARKRALPVITMFELVSS